MFILIMLANATTLIILSFLILYWESTPTARKRNNENYKQLLYQSVTQITHQQTNK